MTTRDFTGLVDSVASWLHRSNLAGQIPVFIMLAESRIYRKLRVQAMESVFTVTASGGTAPLPDRYVEMKHIRIDGQQPLTRKAPSWIYDQYPTSSTGGQLRHFGRDRDALIFGPAPTDGAVLIGTYYRRPEALGEDNPSNWFTENAFDLLMFGALCEAAPYTANDARIAVWEAKYQSLLFDTQTEDDNEATSGPALSLSIG